MGAPAASDPMVPAVVRVARVRRELIDAWTLEIDPGADGFTFAPGQFNMLYAFGVGEAAISISGDPARPETLVHTVRVVGKVSAALAALKAGDWLGVRGPYGHGWPVEAAAGSDVLVIAGGLGLAPLRPCLYRLFAERDRFGRIVVLCGARSPTEILYRAELERWRRRLDIDVEVTVDHAGPDWHGNVGVVTDLIRRAAFDPPNTVAMLCGPEIMMRVAALETDRAGVTANATHLSLERNMKCAIAHCGHCQFSGDFVCRDGPVATYARLSRLLALREI